jgi:formylglycine-generating enzyme required for sulfatase activity
MNLVLIPSCKDKPFIMGPTLGEGDRSGEKQHGVKISRPFYLGAHEVTVGQFRQFVNDEAYHGGKKYLTEAERDGKGCIGWYEEPRKFTTEPRPRFNWDNPGWEQTKDHPVVNVSWNDAVASCKWLSQKEGKFYDLPTEAEWEYACRAGTTTAYWTGDDYQSLKGAANLADKSYHNLRKGGFANLNWDDGFAFTAPVGKFKPNPWGLYDMIGNAAEWCADSPRVYVEDTMVDPEGPSDDALDRFGSRQRMTRGGSWTSEYYDCSSSARRPVEYHARSYSIGFRVVMRPGAQLP